MIKKKEKKCKVGKGPQGLAQSDMQSTPPPRPNKPPNIKTFFFFFFTKNTFNAVQHRLRNRDDDV